MKANEFANGIQAGDEFDLEFSDKLCITTQVVESTDDSITIVIDETAERILSSMNFLGEELDQNQLDEAEYRGRKVPLGKKMKGDVKKSKVYVRKPNGNVVKVEFGDPNMRIKKSNPKRRKSFRARHNCDNPGPRWKARYWSCRAW